MMDTKNRIPDMMTCDVTFVQLQPGLRETEMAPLTEKMTFNRFQLEENHLAPGLKLLACRDVFLVWFKAHVGQ